MRCLCHVLNKLIENEIDSNTDIQLSNTEIQAIGTYTNEMIAKIVTEGTRSLERPLVVRGTK